MNMKMINLTPHTISILDGANNPVLVLPSAGVARAASTRTCVGTVDADGISIPVNVTSFGDVVGLPDPQPGIGYVVSVLTAQAVKNRDDIFVTDDAVRDAEGRIIGCRALARV